jgi:putative transposase
MNDPAMEYYAKGCTISKVVKLLGLSKSTYYHRPGIGVPGRPTSTHTMRMDGTMVPDKTVVEDIMEMLAMDFVDYGYRKAYEWLKWVKRYIVNHKKVLRLMRENQVTLPRRSGLEGQDRKRITEKVPQPTGPRQRIEVDIKYIRVHGQRRNALVLNFVDLFHREWLPFHVGWNIRKEDFIRMLRALFGDQQLKTDGMHMVIRTDNGSQFIATEVAKWMEHMGIEHEFIHAATPEENAHVESFHSVMQRAMIRTREFHSLKHLHQTLDKFRHFYNHERLHSATCYRPPIVFLKLWEQGHVNEVFGSKNKRKFILSKEGRLRPPFSEQNVFPCNNVSHNHLYL